MLFHNLYPETLQNISEFFDLYFQNLSNIISSEYKYLKNTAVEDTINGVTPTQAILLPVLTF